MGSVGSRYHGEANEGAGHEPRNGRFGYGEKRDFAGRVQVREVPRVGAYHFELPVGRDACPIENTNCAIDLAGDLNPRSEF